MSNDMKKMLLKKMARKDKILADDYMDDVFEMQKKVDDISDERSKEEMESDALKNYLKKRKERGL